MKVFNLSNVTNAIKILNNKRKTLNGYLNHASLWESGEHEDSKLEMIGNIEACNEAILILQEKAESEEVKAENIKLRQDLKFLSEMFLNNNKLRNYNDEIRINDLHNYVKDF